MMSNCQPCRRVCVYAKKGCRRTTHSLRVDIFLAVLILPSPLFYRFLSGGKICQTSVVNMICISIAAALVAGICSFTSAQVTDLILDTAVTNNWLEVGFIDIDDREWTTISTTSTGWMKDTTVFVSLPDIGGNTFDDPSNTFLAPRVKSKVTEVDNSRTFQVKLQQGNDSFCSKEFYVPQYLSSKVQVSWMVVQQGAYELDNAMFIIGEGDMTRTDADSTATVENGNAIRIWYPENCTGVVGYCTHNGTTLGAVAQLQTDNNKIDNDQEFFLYVRIRVIFSRHIQLVLVPHSSTDPSIFAISTPETAGYIVFDTPLNIQCLEKMVFETEIYTPVTSTAINVNYQNTYLYPPGLYGSISTVSLVDATVLRQFGNGINSGNFITQEDQCAEEQTIHTAEETAYIIVVGEVVSTPTLQCQVTFTGVVSSPTLAPTTVCQESKLKVSTVKSRSSSP